MIFGFWSHECVYLIEYEYSNITLYVDHYFHLQDWSLFLKEQSCRPQMIFLFTAGCPILATILYPHVISLQSMRGFFLFQEWKNRSWVSLPEISWKPFVLMIWRIIVIFLTMCHQFNLKLSWFMYLSEKKIQL